MRENEGGGTALGGGYYRRRLMEILVDGVTVEAREGDDVLTALARTGRLPAGCLCMGGDCPNCLAIVDGITHVRMCRTRVRPGMTVVPFPVGDPPPIPDGTTTAGSTRRFVHTDVVVVGGGSDGRAEAERLERSGRHVVVIDDDDGNEALGIYAGPEVVDDW